VAGSRHLNYLIKLRDLGRWFRKGFWAVTDQGLFAASNFVLSLFLARWLTPDDYGAFAATYAIFWLLGTFHTALLSEPMLVFGRGKYHGRLSEYLSVLSYGHLGFAVLYGSLLLSVGLGFWLMGSRIVSSALFSLALAGPFILFLWLMRRACYIRLAPHLGASGGVLYMALMLAGIYLLRQLNWLSVPTAFGLMGLASLVASLWLIMRLRVERFPLTGKGLVREVLGVHWNYGRWGIGAVVLSWIPQNVFYILLPIWSGLEAGASLRALMNLLTPILHVTSALSMLLMPVLVEAQGRTSFRRIIRVALAVTIFYTSAYWVLLGLFHQPLISLLYGGAYKNYADLLWLLGLLPILLGVGDILSAVSRVLGWPDRVFWAAAVYTLVTLSAGLALVAAWGVVGASIALLVSSVVGIGALIVFLAARKADIR
jgi:O-antigen/teichoic acid export membrane protein